MSAQEFCLSRAIQMFALLLLLLLLLVVVVILVVLQSPLGANRSAHIFLSNLML